MSNPTRLAPANSLVSERFPTRFIAISIGISWTCWFLVAGTGRNVFTDLEVGLIYVLGGFGPAIAGILMVYGTNDEETIRDYWRRVFDFRRIGARWYLPILLLYPASVLLAFAVSRTPVDLTPLRDLLQNPPYFLTTAAFIFLVGPFSEELGWRDYALDWLQARYSAGMSSLILGVIWWAWHLPLVAVTGSFLNTTGNDPVFITGFLVTVLLYSILFTWVYNNNRCSVLAIILFHFSINLTSRLILMPAHIFAVAMFVLLTVVSAVVVYYGWGRLVRSSPASPIPAA